MDFCKKISIYLFILALCSFCTGCKQADQKAFFKRESAYDQFVQSSADDQAQDSSKPKRVGDVIYLGSESDSTDTKVAGEPSFKFEDLKR